MFTTNKDKATRSQHQIPAEDASWVDDDDLTQLRDSSRDQSTKVAGLTPKVLKARFVLEEQLGSGGMGTVYRAKDLRKVEARNKHPYLAIKVLNGDFREHPDAFIALEREAVKSQSLSHPNIVSIFDFDKDGDVPFMTMELLQGEELATRLKQYPQGLPATMAWALIEGFCQALQHAHSEGLIHADLKPGNVFVTASGQAKVLDFGLARAVAENLTAGVLQTRADLDDDGFDPAGLGALTPAFASRAILNGATPGPSDDIFGAALVIYLILMGRHPYNRIPANKIDPRVAEVERPKMLSSRQWRALSSALALDEVDRLGSMSELTDGLFGETRRPIKLVLVGVCVFALVVTSVYLQKESEIQQVQQQVVVAVAEAEVSVRLDRMIDLLRAPIFDSAWEQQVESELARLEALPDSANLYVDVKFQLAHLYGKRVEETLNLEAAAALLLRGRRYGDLSATANSLRARQATALTSVLALAQPTWGWIERAETALLALENLGRIESDAALNTQEDTQEVAQEVALARLEVNDAYLGLLADSEDEIAPELSQRLLALLLMREFDTDRIDAVRAAVAQRAEGKRLAEQRQEARAKVQVFASDLAPMGCMAAQLPALQRDYTALRATAGVDARALRIQLDQALRDCVTQLLVSDPDAAASLRSDALDRFGRLPALSAIAIDPCDRLYLVGQGTRPGRAGYCSDTLNEREIGPQLVVIPASPTFASFAIAKYETSWREFDEFCRSEMDAECSVDPTRVVSEVTIATANAYAQWLSARSGFHYRIPTLEEWRWAAGAGIEEPDPNRNCMLHLAGVVRGGNAIAATSGVPNGYGLVNLLGNVSEWAYAASTLMSAGGHFGDPIEDCQAHAAREDAGTPQANQGFRLVRELARTPVATFPGATLPGEVGR